MKKILFLFIFLSLISTLNAKIIYYAEGGFSVGNSKFKNLNSDLNKRKTIGGAYLGGGININNSFDIGLNFSCLTNTSSNNDWDNWDSWTYKTHWEDYHYSFSTNTLFLSELDLKYSIFSKNNFIPYIGATIGWRNMNTEFHSNKRKYNLDGNDFIYSFLVGTKYDFDNNLFLDFYLKYIPSNEISLSGERKTKYYNDYKRYVIVENFKKKLKSHLISANLGIVYKFI